jgi:hypothetical protein
MGADKEITMSVNIQESFQKLSLGDKIMLIAGPLLLIDSFLNWYSVKACFLDVCASASRSGWQSPGALWSILAVLIGVLLSGGIAAMNFANVKMPALPQGLTWARVDLGAAVAAAVFILLKLLGESSHLAYGFFIGIILVAALVVGAFLNFQAEREGKGGATTSSM